MYVASMLAVMIVFPVFIMIPLMINKIEPKKTVFAGIVAGWGSVVLLFAVAYYMGYGIGDKINLQIKDAIDMIVSDRSITDYFVKNGVSQEVLTKRLADTYNLLAMMMPASIMVVGSLIAVVLYKVLWLVGFRRSGKTKKFKLSEYSLNSSILFKWIAIFAVAYLIGKSGNSLGTVVSLNLEYIIRLLLILEGILAIFDIGTKGYRYAKPFVILVIIGLFIVPYGNVAFVIVGLFSTMYQLRRPDILSRFKR